MRGRLASLAAAAALLAFPAAAAAAADAPWQQAAAASPTACSTPRPSSSSTAPTRPSRTPTRARDAYAGDLRDTLREADPAADEAITDGAAATRPTPPASGDQRGARRRPRHRPRRALPRRLLGHHRGHRTRRRGDREALAAAARVPHRDPLHPPGRARDARARPARARQAHRRGRRPGGRRKDLLDAYQARLRELLDDARRGIKNDFPARRAEAAAQAAGYFAILAPRYTEDRGAAAEEQASAAFAALPEAGDGLAAALDAGRRGARGLHRRAVHPRGGRAPRPAAAAVPRARAGRVRPRHQGRPGHPRLRDHRRPSRSAPAPSPRSPTCATSSPSATRRAPTAGAAALTELGRQVGIAAQAEAGRARRTSRCRRSPTQAETALTRRDAEGLDGEDRRVRLRPDRAHARPHGGRRRRRPVPPGRAGAPRGLRVLRVRPRAAAALVRPGPRARHRGPDLVRRRRPGRASPS